MEANQEAKKLLRKVGMRSRVEQRQGEHKNSEVGFWTLDCWDLMID